MSEREREREREYIEVRLPITMDMYGTISIWVVNHEDAGDNVIIRRRRLENASNGRVGYKVFLRVGFLGLGHFAGGRDDPETFVAHLECYFECLHPMLLGDKVLEYWLNIMIPTETFTLLGSQE